jgi:hypothetical protein
MPLKGVFHPRQLQRRITRGNTEGTATRAPAVTCLPVIPSFCATFVPAASRACPRFPLRRSMVRRYSALQPSPAPAQLASANANLRVGLLSTCRQRLRPLLGGNSVCKTICNPGHGRRRVQTRWRPSRVRSRNPCKAGECLEITDGAGIPGLWIARQGRRFESALLHEKKARKRGPSGKRSAPGVVRRAREWSRRNEGVRGSNPRVGSLESPAYEAVARSF